MEASPFPSSSAVDECRWGIVVLDSNDIVVFLIIMMW